MNNRPRWKGRAGQVIVAAFVIIFTVIPGPRPAAACTCGVPTAGLAEIFAKPDTTAFIGRVTSVSRPAATEFGDATFTFTVERPLKGAAGPTIQVRTRASGATCGVDYPLDVSIGVTLQGTGESAFEASLCSSYGYTTDINAFSTWFSGTLPPPNGSGRIAGFGYIGPQTYGVVDEQMRVLGYVPMPKPTYLETCPGGRFVSGVETVSQDDDGNVTERLVSVNLTTLVTTRVPVRDVLGLWCLDSDGRALVQQAPSESGSLKPLLITSRSGAQQQVSPVAGALEFLGPTLGGDGLVWLTEAEAVVTDLNGNVLKRLAAPRSEFPFRYLNGGRLDLSPGGTSATFVDVMTGARSTVSNRSEWTYVNQRLWKLTNPTTLEVIDTATGQSSQIQIGNGPSDDGWTLARGVDILQLVKDNADVFYVIDALGNATAFPSAGRVDNRTAWVGNSVFALGDSGDAWVLSASGRQRVLEPYGPSFIERIDGPTLSAGACGTVAIPTLNYTCKPPTLPELR